MGVVGLVCLGKGSMRAKRRHLKACGSVRDKGMKAWWLVEKSYRREGAAWFE